MSCRILQGDCLSILNTLPNESVQCCVTSPPYWGLRDYGVEGQLGLERTPEEYVAKMIEVFRGVRRVLRSDGMLWLNLGDSYNGSGRKNERINPPKQMTNRGATSQRGMHVLELKPKDLVGIPWMVAFALRADGWYLRQDIIWNKPNPMPESVTDRCTKSHEYIFLLTKSERYYYDHEAIKEDSVTNDPRRPYGSQGAWDMDGRPSEQRHGGEPRSWHGSRFDTGKTAEHQLNRSQPVANRKRGEFDGKTNALPGREAFRQFTETRNKRSVWTVTTKAYSEAHFATFPREIPETCILAGSKEGDTVLDPFSGAGTTGLVATRLGRNYLGIELNPEYVAMSERRITKDAPLFNEVTA